MKINIFFIGNRNLHGGFSAVDREIFISSVQRSSYLGRDSTLRMIKSCGNITFYLLLMLRSNEARRTSSDISSSFRRETKSTFIHKAMNLRATQLKPQIKISLNN